MVAIKNPDSGSGIETIKPGWTDRLSHGQAAAVVDRLRWGAIAIGPSDCGYALWAMPTVASAMASVDQILDHASVPIPVTIGSVRDAEKLIDLEIAHYRLANGGWPGGLTMVVSAPRLTPARKFAHALHGETTIGLRVSLSWIEREVALTAYMPITSAAIRYPDGSLVQSYIDAETIVLERMDAMNLTNLLIGIPYSGEFLLSVNSTVVEVREHSKLSIIRPGYFDRNTLKGFTSRMSVEEMIDVT